MPAAVRFLAWAGSWPSSDLAHHLRPRRHLVLSELRKRRAAGNSTLLTPFVIVPVFFIFQGAAGTSGHAVLPQHRRSRCESRYLHSDWDVDRARASIWKPPAASAACSRAYNRTVIFLSRNSAAARGVPRRFPSLSAARACLGAAGRRRPRTSNRTRTCSRSDRISAGRSTGSSPEHPPPVPDHRPDRRISDVVINNPYGVMLRRAHPARNRPPRRPALPTRTLAPSRNPLPEP